MRAITVLVLTVMLLSLSAEFVFGYETENVVLVIIDGLRYTEGLGDPDHAYVPKMWDLASEGAMIEPFLNDGYTYTARAIPAIWCGAWTEIYQFSDSSCGGQQNNYTRSPTVFEYFRKQLSRPEEDCIYVLKDVGCPWKASFDPDYGPDYWPLYHSEGTSDLDVWHEAVDILETYAPSLFLLYLAEVDHAGHSGNWNYYTNSIATADSIVGMLWELLEEHPSYSGKTTMFVTNDHGRHDYDWTGHGCDCSGCRTIQLLAVGPDIEEGLVANESRTLRDITPTIGELLGFIAEDATGVILEEILKDQVIVERDVTRPGGRELRIEPISHPFTAHRGEFLLTIPASGQICVSVLDLCGRILAVPFEGFLQAGEHRLAWNQDVCGALKPTSGVYMVILSDGGRSVSRRVVLIQ